MLLRLHFPAAALLALTGAAPSLTIAPLSPVITPAAAELLVVGAAPAATIYYADGWSPVDDSTTSEGWALVSTGDDDEWLAVSTGTGDWDSILPNGPDNWVPVDDSHSSNWASVS